MANILEEAFMKKASSTKSHSNQGDQFLDRTIYYVKEKTDTEGKTVYDGAGEPLLELRVYRTAGSWITQTMMERAMEIEKEFSKLNKQLRDDMEAIGLTWRLKRSDVKAMEIAGVI